VKRNPGNLAVHSRISLTLNPGYETNSKPLSEGSRDTMAKRNQAKLNLAGDILRGLQEALKYTRGEKAGVIVHRVVPSAAKARRARIKLGVSRRPARSRGLS